MKVTKLHLLLLFFLCAIGYFGHYFFSKAQEKKRLELELQLKKDEELRRAEEERQAQVLLSSQAEVSAAEEEKNKPHPIMYEVRRGDTLWSIAKKSEHFGQGHRWYDIWKANSETISDFDHIPVGLQITIPLDKSEDSHWPITPLDQKEKILNQSHIIKELEQETTNEIPNVN